MKKICYWSPHISHVATIKNVINSAISIKKFAKKETNVKIFDVVGEWMEFKEILDFNNIELLRLSNLRLAKFLPITGFVKSRFIYFLIFFLKINQLKNILKKEKPDFLIIHLITVVPLFLLIFFKFQTKFILRISGLPKYTIFRKFLWKIISKKIYLVTCPSEQTKNDLIKLKIFPKEKLKILYDPILNINKISEQIKEKNKYNDKIYFINIGRLTRQKNQILLIKAFSQLLKKKKDLNLYIAGDGEEKINLERYIQSNSLEKNIFLLGHVENVYPIIRDSLALISSSLWEDPGAVMIETAYCNKIVISSNCPNGPEEFLKNGKGGFLFKNNDALDLENKINEFLNEIEGAKFKKTVISKKNSKMYSLFRHYLELNKILFQKI